jgi:hypothetical protein
MFNMLLALTVALSLTQLAPADDVPLFGRLGPRLSREDVVAIAEAAASAPWALSASRSQVLPVTWHVDAFLSPALSTERLRRGPVLHLVCTPANEDGPCLHWRIEGDVGAYVQLADGPAFTPSVAIRRPSERPIRVKGDFTESDLVRLILYIRSKPSPKVERGWVAMGVSGQFPITSIERQADGLVWVQMTDDGIIGELAVVRRTRHGWQVTEVGSWVA